MSHKEGHSRQREQPVQRSGGQLVENFKEETRVAGMDGGHGGDEVREGVSLARKTLGFYSKHDRMH